MVHFHRTRMSYIHGVFAATRQVLLANANIFDFFRARLCMYVASIILAIFSQRYNNIQITCFCGGVDFHGTSHFAPHAASVSKFPRVTRFPISSAVRPQFCVIYVLIQLWKCPRFISSGFRTQPAIIRFDSSRTGVKSRSEDVLLPMLRSAVCPSLIIFYYMRTNLMYALPPTDLQ